MPGRSLFEQACIALESCTDLDKLESRGTIRLALKSAGLDAESLSEAQLKVVLEKVLPAELAARGIADPEAACREVGSAVDGSDETARAKTSPEEIFSRLGG